ncbi:hypothetical protein B0T19DRAFT_425312 [Cercophora scortea]|uniref:Uncharacterized protein n=1 Tax=Cercophora scortea TaxID=314031 RepID=A0AAE0IDU0_9PEZI|nr:hypothetical protein B0T19DRAFT_425312 [Cercophora scortea]
MHSRLLVLLGLQLLQSCSAQAQGQHLFKWSSPDNHYAVARQQVHRRQGQIPGYHPEFGTCGSGTTCQDACGSNWLSCNASTTLSLFCYNKVDLHQTCCENGSGRACDEGYYCAWNEIGGKVWCCVNGQSLEECGVVALTSSTSSSSTTSSTTSSTSSSSTVSSSSTSTSSTSSSTVSSTTSSSCSSTTSPCPVTTITTCSSASVIIVTSTVTVTSISSTVETDLSTTTVTVIGSSVPPTTTTITITVPSSIVSTITIFSTVSVTVTVTEPVGPCTPSSTTSSPTPCSSTTSTTSSTPTPCSTTPTPVTSSSSPSSTPCKTTPTIPGHHTPPYITDIHYTTKRTTVLTTVPCTTTPGAVHPQKLDGASGSATTTSGAERLTSMPSILALVAAGVWLLCIWI